MNIASQRIGSIFPGLLKGLLGLAGLAIAAYAAYHVFAGVSKDYKDQKLVYQKDQSQFQAKRDTPQIVAVVTARYPDVEAECGKRIKFYSDSFFASVSRDIRSWRVTPAGRRIYTVSYECAVINKTLATVDIEPLEIGSYILKTDYRVDLNQNKILQTDVSTLLGTIGRSSWYQKLGK